MNTAIPKSKAANKTTMVESRNSVLVGQAAFFNSMMVSRLKVRIFLKNPISIVWHGRRDSNPQPSVLETDALPIEPLP